MIAEFASYRSWIAWVPILSLLAIPLVFRRLPVVVLAMIGAFVGFVAISLTSPLGRNAEMFGANIALGLVGGAAVGAFLGAAIVLGHRTAAPVDASVIVVGFALGLGLTGAVVAGFAPSILAGRPPDLNVVVLRFVAIGGGLGWSAGAVVGWRAARSAPPPSRTQRLILSIAAAGIAITGAGIVGAIQQQSFGPSIEDLSRWERQDLALTAALYGIDTAIAVLTLVVVALRSSVPPTPVPADQAPLPVA